MENILLFVARRLQLWREGSRGSREPWASGLMVALRGTGIVRVPVFAAAAELRLVPPGGYAGAGLLFG
jgi:hypothetical protein